MPALSFLETLSHTVLCNCFCLGNQRPLGEVGVVAIWTFRRALHLPEGGRTDAKARASAGSSRNPALMGTGAGSRSRLDVLIHAEEV